MSPGHFKVKGMNHSFGLDFVILLIYIGLLIFAVYVKNFNIQEIY